MNIDNFIESVELLKPKKNDVVMVKIKDYVGLDTFAPLAEELNDRFKDTLFIFHTGEVSLLNESEMNQAGWIKKTTVGDPN